MVFVVLIGIYFFTWFCEITVFIYGTHISVILFVRMLVINSIVNKFAP